MTSIIIETKIRAPIELCFDLARDVKIHCETAAFSSERVVPPGRTEGRLELGDMVAFEGRHFGVKQRVVARITVLKPPHRFDDEMVQGYFKWLRHFHEFWYIDGVTTMRDTLLWEPPLGIIGRVADHFFIRDHMHWFVTTKQNRLKHMAEARAGATINP